jgi:hypothetical protein
MVVAVGEAAEAGVLAKSANLSSLTFTITVKLDEAEGEPKAEQNWRRRYTRQVEATRDRPRSKSRRRNEDSKGDAKAIDKRASCDTTSPNWVNGLAHGATLYSS